MLLSWPCGANLQKDGGIMRQTCNGPPPRDRWSNAEGCWTGMDAHRTGAERRKTVRSLLVTQAPAGVCRSLCISPPSLICSLPSTGKPRPSRRQRRRSRAIGAIVNGIDQRGIDQRGRCYVPLSLSFTSRCHPPHAQSSPESPSCGKLFGFLKKSKPDSQVA